MRHDDGDPGVRGGAVQHILGARRADMLLRGLSLYHEACIRVARPCHILLYPSVYLPLLFCARTLAIRERRIAGDNGDVPRRYRAVKEFCPDLFSK